MQSSQNAAKSLTDVVQTPKTIQLEAEAEINLG